ncbi:MAG: hypothetical protein PHR58_08150 [Sphaerochaetaceae bacterium]|nr:hypothetical protein [Sphaerochaetaceae bacterium]NLO60260.1 hypothetical protein [Spirochaetales bacterium]
MKKVLLVMVLVMLVVLPLSAAKYDKSNGIGVGFSGGYPVSGVAVKYGMDDFRLVGTLGYNYGSAFSIEAGAQYDVTEFEIAELPFYLNVGVTGALHVRFSGGLGFSVNVPVGVSYFFEDFPVEVFLKVAPGIGLLPVRFDIGASLGALYYLDK